VFDAMGHGLAAAGVAAFAVAAYRHGRRAGNDLVETHETMDDAVGRQFPDSRFVTAVIAQLELETGTFHWISAGHPPPLRIRAGHAQELELVPTMPLGVELGRKDAAVGEEALEPGDQVLLYTDGLTEARGPEGKVFAVDGLREFVEHAAAAGQPAPETLRRLRETLRESGQAQLRDDATALLVEWRGGSERELVPQTVF
jgi:serine phosphatase RsbU (regulator of sigma subunit)